MANETLHRRIIPRRFAIATKEVSLAQFEEFLKEHPEIGSSNAREFSPDPGALRASLAGMPRPASATG